MNIKHEFNATNDQEIQAKLLEADDNLTKENIINMAASYLKPKLCEALNLYGALAATNNLGQRKPNSHKTHANDGSNICGWFVNPKVTFRKTESAPAGRLKGNSRACDKDYLPEAYKHSQNDFVFHHYSDSKRYIEQYRRENSCVSNGSAVKNKLLEQRSCSESDTLIAPTNSPLCAQQFSSLQSVQLFDNYFQNREHTTLLEQRSSQPHFITKRDNQRQIISANLFKNLQKHFKFPSHLSQVETPVLLSSGEKDSIRDKLKMCSSELDDSLVPAINIVSLNKNIDTKVSLQTLPTTSEISLHNLKTKSASLRCPKDTFVTYQFLGHKIGSQSANQLRTIESGVAGNEKQSSLARDDSTDSLKSVPKHVSVSSTPESSKLSEEGDCRIVLAPDVNNLVRNGKVDQDRNGLNSRSGQSLSKQKYHHDFDIILTPNVDSKLDYGYTISLNDFVADSSPLLKAQSFKLDISSSLNKNVKQKFSSVSTKKRIAKSKPLGSGYRKSVTDSWSSTDSKQSPWEQKQTSDFPNIFDSKVGKDMNNELRGNSAPYFKFWSSSMPPKSCKMRRNISHEQTLQQLTEWMLADQEASSNDLELAKRARKALEEEQQQSATSTFTSGMWYDPNGRVYMSLATRYENISK
ncbi:uncharacterized protein LOC106080062 isoform X2 [Biomphalaria glabrata]|uniref:Uncharacterized protein LOC106080062 isoform X2 n=1 Tax=Biomphalaria glabrata TaxID=6526 RepID=A0A9W3B916_BIOGL|nr:uncharacterized protein LOC106080062 isoform X2 [Biomphalaria glabrata]